MIAAGGGALGVNGAATANLIQEDTVVIGPAGQSKNFMFEVEVIDQPGFFQPLGELFGRFLGFEGIDEFHTYQIFNPHFYRQAAADRTTVVA